MSTELVTLGSQPQTYIDTGLDDIAPLKPSFLRFLQPSSSDLFGGQAGQFYDEVNAELYDTVTVVPLQIVTNRVMYPPGEAIRSGVKPLCRSDDGKVPSRFIQTPQARSCQSCQYSQWSGDKPSECSSNLKMLVLLKDSGAPRYIVASGTSVSPLRNMLRRINEDIQTQNLKGNPVRLYDYFFTVGSERKRNYFVMTFSDVQRVRELGEFGPRYEQFVKAVQTIENGVPDDAVDAELVNEI